MSSSYSYKCRVNSDIVSPLLGIKGHGGVSDVSRQRQGWESSLMGGLCAQVKIQKGHRQEQKENTNPQETKKNDSSRTQKDQKDGGKMLVKKRTMITKKH